MQQHILFINTTYSHEDAFNSCINGDYDNCSFSVVDHAQIDPTLVPEGRGSLMIMTLDSYENWKGLSGDDYKRKKTEIADKLIRRLERYLPDLRKYIEVMEVATPKAISRFGLSPEGAIYGFSQRPGQSGINRLSQETKIKGLFLAGAWTRPGAGVHGCVVSGLDAADLVLKLLRKS